MAQVKPWKGLFSGLLRKSAPTVLHTPEALPPDPPKAPPAPDPCPAPSEGSDTPNNSGSSTSSTYSNSSYSGRSNISIPASDVGALSRAGGSSSRGRMEMLVTPRELFVSRVLEVQCCQGPKSDVTKALEEAAGKRAADWVDHRTRCILLLHLGLESGATKPFQDALEHAAVVAYAMPHSPLPHLLKAAAYFFLGQRGPALAECQQAAHLNPGHTAPQAWLKLLLADGALRECAFQEALRVCQEGQGFLCQADTEDYSWALHPAVFPLKTAFSRIRSLAAMRLGKVHDLKQDLEDSRGPTAQARAEFLGEVQLLFSAAPGDAAKALAQANEGTPDGTPRGSQGGAVEDVRGRVLLLLAEARVAQGEGDGLRAVLGCSRALTLVNGAGEGVTISPYFATMRSLRSMVCEMKASAHHSLGETSLALETAEILLQQEPKLQSAHFRKALSLLHLNGLDAATTLLDQAQTDWPHAQWPVFLEHVASGAVAAQLGTFHKAVKEANQAIKVYPEVEPGLLQTKDLALCHRLRCYALFMNGKRDSAVQEALEALRLDPGCQVMEELSQGRDVGPKELWSCIFDAPTPFTPLAPGQYLAQMGGDSRTLLSTVRSTEPSAPHPAALPNAGTDLCQAGGESHTALSSPQCPLPENGFGVPSHQQGEANGSVLYMAPAPSTVRRGSSGSTQAGIPMEGLPIVEESNAGDCNENKPAAQIEEMRTGGSHQGTGDQMACESSERSLGEDTDQVGDLKGTRIKGGMKQRWLVDVKQQRVSFDLSFVLQYTPEELCEATGNFDEGRKLGHGAYATVYHGSLRGTPVAIKRMAVQDWSASGIDAEIQVLSRIRHPHIVALMGVCPQGPHPCIVYEFLSGGDLYHNLNPEQDTSHPLTCLDRFRIVKEIASALAFMSQHDPPIVHRDLKPQNILLDQHGTAKIADWGLAKDVKETMRHQSMAGTRGYIAPELAAFDRELSTATDIYAFGVILLQLFTGSLRAGDVHELASEYGDCGSRGFDPGALLPHLDAAASPWPLALAQRGLAIGLRCVSANRRARPDLTGEILPELESVFAEAEGSTEALVAGFGAGTGGGPVGVTMPSGGGVGLGDVPGRPLANGGGARNVGSSTSWAQARSMAGSAGHSNSGQGSSSHANSGQGNSGQANSGQSNSGQANSGHGYSGHANSGHGSSGACSRGSSEGHSQGEAHAPSRAESAEPGAASADRGQGTAPGGFGSSARETVAHHEAPEHILQDKVEEALMFLEELQLTDQETADAVEVLTDPAQAKVFCALRGTVRKIWIKKKLQGA